MTITSLDGYRWLNERYYSRQIFSRMEKLRMSLLTSR